MKHTQVNSRLHFTLAVACFAVLHIAIELLSGGVNVHYPLQRDDLPAISNWWGLAVLPALAWACYGFMEKDTSLEGPLGLNKPVPLRMAFAFIYGGVLAATFELGLGQLPLYCLLGLVLFGVFYPLYRSEIILGLVMGMTYTFGAVIPTVVIGLVALTSLLTHGTGRFIIRKFTTRAV